MAMRRMVMGALALSFLLLSGDASADPKQSKEEKFCVIPPKLAVKSGFGKPRGTVYLQSSGQVREYESLCVKGEHKGKNVYMQFSCYQGVIKHTQFLSLRSSYEGDSLCPMKMEGRYDRDDMSAHDNPPCDRGKKKKALPYAQLSKLIYSCETGKTCEGHGWKRVETGKALLPKGEGIIPLPNRTISVTEAGFKAAIMEHENGDVALVFEGTHPNPLVSGADWPNNIENWFGADAPYYRAARAVAVAAKAKYKGRLKHITGHSLGGGQAAWASFHTKVPATVFNPASVKGGEGPEDFKNWANKNVDVVIVENEALEELRRVGNNRAIAGKTCSIGIPAQQRSPTEILNTASDAIDRHSMDEVLWALGLP